MSGFQRNWVGRRSGYGPIESISSSNKPFKQVLLSGKRYKF